MPSFLRCEANKASKYLDGNFQAFSGFLFFLFIYLFLLLIFSLNLTAGLEDKQVAFKAQNRKQGRWPAILVTYAYTLNLYYHGSTAP